MVALTAARRLRANGTVPTALLRCSASTPWRLTHRRWHYDPAAVGAVNSAGEPASPPEQAQAQHTDHRWALMQLTDASLPTGGFAHSAGLEAAWQQGRVRDTQQLLSFVRAAVGQAAHSSVPFVAAAHTAAIAGLTGQGEPAASALRKWADVDRRQHALLCGNATAARASQLQGSALLRVAEPLLADLGLDGGNPSRQASRSAVHQLQAALRSPDPSGAIGGTYTSPPTKHNLARRDASDRLRVTTVVHGHHAPVFGLVSGVLQLPADVVVEAFLFTVLNLQKEEEALRSCSGPFLPPPLPLTPPPLSIGRCRATCSRQRCGSASLVPCTAWRCSGSSPRSPRSSWKRSPSSGAILSFSSSFSLHFPFISLASRIHFGSFLVKRGSLDESSAAQTAPMIELLQGNHPLLYSRLFQS